MKNLKGGKNVKKKKNCGRVNVRKNLTTGNKVIFYFGLVYYMFKFVWNYVMGLLFIWPQQFCCTFFTPNYISYLHTIQTPTRSLRSNSAILLMPPKITTKTYSERSFQFAAPKLWNNLPINIRNAPDMDTFKSALKTYLIVTLIGPYDSDPVCLYFCYCLYLYVFFNCKVHWDRFWYNALI